MLVSLYKALCLIHTLSSADRQLATIGRHVFTRRWLTDPGVCTLTAQFSGLKVRGEGTRLTHWVLTALAEVAHDFCSCFRPEPVMWSVLSKGSWNLDCHSQVQWAGSTYATQRIPISVILIIYKLFLTQTC